MTFLEADGSRPTLTYEQLVARARSIAGHLLQRAEPGDRAVLTYPAGLAFVEAFFGCLYAGVVAVPAFPPKKNRNADRVRAIAADCEPRLFLCTRETHQNLGDDFAPATASAVVLCTDELDCSNPTGLPTVAASQLAFLQYTSGSTSTPKGVMVTHGNIAANEAALCENFAHGKQHVAVSWLPMFHDMGLLGGLLQPVFVGFHGVSLAPAAFLRDPIAWLQAITDYRGVFSGAPNFAYDLCVRTVSDAQKRKLDLSSWVAFNGAEPVRGDTLRNFTEAFAGCGFRAHAFMPCYGLAEATLFVAGGPPLQPRRIFSADCAALQQHRFVEAATGRTIVSCGKPAPDLAVRIVDPETRVVCAADTIGEIWLHGRSVTQGYFRRQEATAQTFAAELIDDPRRWLRTGDYGFLRDGELFVTGRLKDMIIVRGRNVYPQDVEQLVMRHIPFVEPNACAAFAVERSGEERLVVVVEGTRDMVRWSRDPAAVPGEVAALRRELAELQQAVLESFETALTDFVILRPASFPRTSSGKVQRLPCRRLYEERQLDRLLEDALAGASSVEPQCASAAIVRGALQAWASARHMRLHRIERATSFASLGIDSLAAAEIIALLEQRSGCSIPLDTLCQHGSVGALEDHLVDLVKHRDAAQAAPRPCTKGDYVAHYATRMRRFHELRQGGRGHFGTPIASQDGGHVVVGGRRMMMLASYSYLGLIGHHEVQRAAIDAVARCGTGTHGVRMLAGTLEDHRSLEMELAEFMQAEDAIVYSSGFMTNLATIAALVGKGDVVIGDERNHASIHDGCTFSGAEFATFRHNDVDELEQLLRRHAGRRILVVVDAVYSMDGDIAPLPRIVDLCRDHGALLMVDEAHSLGVLGATGRGIQQHFGLPADAIDFKMGTLSKAIASCGGFVAARHEFIDYLRHTARGFVFSAALPPAQVGAARKCLEILRTQPHLARRVQEVAVRFTEGVRQLGFRVADTRSPIVPILFASEAETMDAVGFCRARGLFVVPVVHPAVPMDTPRIRATLMASHSDEDVAQALSVFAELAQAKRQAARTRSPEQAA
ncbi:MAG TPA: aminotransferase class I/II-fold pyridoxal phosphate-dependent enzyme [Planctomycetota bacterium]